MQARKPLAFQYQLILCMGLSHLPSCFVAGPAFLSGYLNLPAAFNLTIVATLFRVHMRLGRYGVYCTSRRSG